MIKSYYIYGKPGCTSLLKIFIADDDITILSGLRAIIENYAYECEVLGEATNGLAALKGIQDLQPDLLITDIKMPGMNGIELIKSLKSQGSKTRIIVLSGFDEYNYVRDSLRQGALDYLLKPVQNEDLLQLLEKVKLEIEEERKVEEKKKQLSEIIESSTDTVKEKFLMELVEGNYERALEYSDKLGDSEVLKANQLLLSIIKTDDLYYFQQQEVEISDPEQIYQSMKPIDASVPGNVELDLMKAGELPDVFHGNNIYSLKPYEHYEYWYRKEFETPEDIDGKTVELVFNGVDCIAKYWLNGKEIGHSDNMFIEHRFDITGILKPGGSNKLAVRLQSPVIEAMNKEYTPSNWALNTNWEQLWIRKAAHSYGWDILPRAVSAGLWRDVEIIVHDDNEIKDLYFYTRSCGKEKASIGINYQLKLDRNMTENLRFEVEGHCADSSFSIKRNIFLMQG